MNSDIVSIEINNIRNIQKVANTHLMEHVASIQKSIDAAISLERIIEKSKKNVTGNVEVIDVEFIQSKIAEVRERSSIWYKQVLMSYSKYASDITDIIDGKEISVLDPSIFENLIKASDETTKS